MNKKIVLTPSDFAAINIKLQNQLQKIEEYTNTIENAAEGIKKSLIEIEIIIRNSFEKGKEDT